MAQFTADIAGMLELFAIAAGPGMDSMPHGTTPPGDGAR